jgi:protein phosphatase 1G
VLCRAGKAIALSEDHKPDDTIEKNRIYAAGGTVVNGRVCENLNLSRALGDFQYKDFSKPYAENIISGVPDIEVLELTAEDEFLILACDGCWERKDRQEVCDFVREKLATADKARASEERLVHTTCLFLDENLCEEVGGENFDGSGCDNMTMMIVQLKPIPAEAAPAEAAPAEAATAA